MESTITESIQKLPPEPGEKILCEFAATKMRECTEMGWDVVHDELSELHDGLFDVLYCDKRWEL